MAEVFEGQISVLNLRLTFNQEQLFENIQQHNCLVAKKRNKQKRPAHLKRQI